MRAVHTLFAHHTHKQSVRLLDPHAGCRAGGIGPTHDDVTYEAVATACSTHCEVHKETLQRMQQHYTSRGVELNDARRRMATLPVGGEVHFTDGLSPPWVPLVELQTILVLPGIPKLFQAMVTGLLHKQPV